MTAVGLNNSAMPTHQTLHCHANVASSASMSVCRSAIKAYNGTQDPSCAAAKQAIPYNICQRAHTHTLRIWILITLAPDTHATGERKKTYKIYIRYIYFVVISVVRQSIVLKFGIEITWYIFYKLHEAGFKIGTAI